MIKRLKKLADNYYENNDQTISKNQLQIYAENCCDSLGVEKSTIDINDGRITSVTFGNENEFIVSIDFYNNKTGPEINRIITSVSRNFPGKIHYVETRDQQYLNYFINETSYFVDWVDECLEKIENSEIPKSS